MWGRLECVSVSSRVCERQRHCAYASEWVVSCHINYGQGLSFIQTNLLKLYKFKV